mgnify:CR=1 FL=1
MELFATGGGALTRRSDELPRRDPEHHMVWYLQDEGVGHAQLLMLASFQHLFEAAIQSAGILWQAWANVSSWISRSLWVLAGKQLADYTWPNAVCKAASLRLDYLAGYT